MVREVEGFDLACVAELETRAVEEAGEDRDEVADFGVGGVFADRPEMRGISRVGSGVTKKYSLFEMRCTETVNEIRRRAVGC